jgi:hypothetical protein
MALAALGVLPPEHIHEAVDGEQLIHHRHEIDSTVPNGERVVHAADHSTVRVIAAVFDTSSVFAPAPALLPESSRVVAAEQTSLGRFITTANPPIHGPPPRPGPSRAPPRS